MCTDAARIGWEPRALGVSAAVCFTRIFRTTIRSQRKKPPEGAQDGQESGEEDATHGEAPPNSFHHIIPAATKVITADSLNIIRVAPAVISPPPIPWSRCLIPFIRRFQLS